MKKIFTLLLPIMLLLPFGLLGQVNFSGELTPGAMLRINDGSLIDLPFRVGTVTLDYAVGDVELKTTTSLETRWKDPEFSEDMLQFREAYLMWYPSFGEVKLGKMIHAWGAADANNPTDNLSPYDYYYMFLAGTDRKLGSLSVAGKAYFGDAQIELIAIPQFEPNRLPQDEPDFPIQIPIPPGARYWMPENEFEFGARIQYAMGMGDISASYFKGNDRSFSPAGIEVNIQPVLDYLNQTPSSSVDFETTMNVFQSNMTSHLTYRSTDMIGLDAVLFPGNWTIRGEFAYFQSQTPGIDFDMSKFSYDAKYLQSVIQAEYSFANNVQLMGQYINTNYMTTDSEFAPGSGLANAQAVLHDTSNHALDAVRDPLLVELGNFGIPEFSAGMGTPFGLISDQVVVLSSMVTLLDNDLELGGMVMINLAETGYMTNLNSSYTLREGLSLDATLSYFIGGDEADNKFKQLEDFSNLNLGLSVSF